MHDKTRQAIAARVVLEFKGHSEVAKALGYEDRRNVWPWTSGVREFPPEHCVTIEIKSNGRITRKELRPSDWQAIWPELIATDGAPAVPEAEAKAA